VNPSASIQKPALPVPVFQVRYRYPHHAGTSGYDRFADYVGEAIPLSKAMYWAGETLLRVPAKLTSWYGGHYEYSRHDFVMEMQAGLHMLRHQRCIYHFLYGEKSFKLLARLKGRNGHRFVATFHHPRDHYPRLFRSTDHLRALDHGVAVSTCQIAFLEEIIGRGRVTFVPYGVDTDFFQPTAVPKSSRPKRCLFVGTHLRDFDSLPMIVARVLEKSKDTEFVLISRDRRCRQVAANRRVIWRDHVSDSDYLDYLRHSDLLVLPMKDSTTVTSVLEALACGVPVVISQGGIADYVDASCGVLLPVGDVDAMAQTTIELLEDETRRMNMAKAARQKALTFSWPQVAEKMAGVYRRVADGMSAPESGDSSARHAMPGLETARDQNQREARVFLVNHHFANIADHSGYDKIERYMGEPVALSSATRWLGETVLRVPAKLVSWYGGSFEYSRHDFVKEWQVALHMCRHRNAIYHFVHGEKSLKLLAPFNGFRGHRMIATFHHPPSHFTWLFRSTRHLRHLSHAIALAGNQVEFLEGIVGKGKVSLVLHGVDTDYFTPAAGLRDPDAPPCCVFAGRHMRDFQNLPAIVSGILANHPRAEFTLISSDRNCERVASHNRVRWLREIPDDQYLQILQQSDIMVLPLVESVAVNSVLEAMACGVPVVTNHGGVDDYLGTDSGMLLPTGDVKGMVQAALDLLQDRRARTGMGQAARRRALELSWPRIAEKLSEVYGRIAEDL
jgi:glycosyltransferase involved in cell wall biosynthesis